MIRSTIAAAAAAAATLVGLAAPAPAAQAVAVPVTAPVSAPLGAPLDRSATSITGTWKGPVISQDGPTGYSGLLRIRRTPDGYTATGRYGSPTYGVLSRTRWVYRGRADGWFVFRERSADGGTVVPTTVKARRDGARLVVRWRDPSGYTGHLRARRA